jgi:hypothetical protein
VVGEKEKLFIYSTREGDWMGKNKIKIQQFQKRKRLEEQKDVEIKKVNCSLISKKRKFGKNVSRSLRKYEMIDF